VNKKVILQRLKEPSTWAGLGMLAMLLGVDPHKVGMVAQAANAILPLLPVDASTLAQIITGVAGLAAVALPERTHTGNVGQQAGK
jgi:hypothetical protein